MYCSVNWHVEQQHSLWAIDIRGNRAILCWVNCLKLWIFDFLIKVAVLKHRAAIMWMCIYRRVYVYACVNVHCLGTGCRGKTNGCSKWKLDQTASKQNNILLTGQAARETRFSEAIKTLWNTANTKESLIGIKTRTWNILACAAGMACYLSTSTGNPLTLVSPAYQSTAQTFILKVYNRICLRGVIFCIKCPTLLHLLAFVYPCYTK